MFIGLLEYLFKDFDKVAFDVGEKIQNIFYPGVTFVKSTSQDRPCIFLKNFNRKNRMVNHICGDFYSSTVIVLISMHYYLKRELIMFDDFPDLVGEFITLVIIVNYLGQN